MRIWTAQRTYITALRHSGKFTETRSGFYGTTEWAEFTIPRDQWSPADRCEAGQQHDRRAEGAGYRADGPVPQTLMLCGRRTAFRRSGSEPAGSAQ